jgi:ABC-type dipeptide/oligopeptide/nickel transport system permease subunit
LVPRFARVARGATLPIRSQDYIVAARSLGAGDWAIIVRHVLRNLVGPLTVLCSIYLPTVILIEASLSFLGIGPPPNIPTWGRIIADGRPYLRTAVWISVAPGIAIMLTVMGFNLVGDGLRDLLDPKTSKAIRRT